MDAKDAKVEKMSASSLNEEELEKSTRKTGLSREKGSRNEAKGWFCTWPKCPVPKEVALKALEKSVKFKIVEYVICEEKHEDGTPHLHAFLKLDRRVKFKSDRFDIQDLDKTYHGNYQKAKCWRAVQDYVKKDGNYISNLNLEAAEKKKAKKIGEEELQRPALDLLREGIISGMQLSSFLKNQNLYKLLKQQENVKQEIELDLPKQRHFWTYGESNTGKTYRLRKLMRENPSDWFQIPTNNDWSGYNGEKNLYIDEYRGQLTIQDLNRICDGGSKVNTKGGTTILNPACVVWINSNFSIEGCYKKAEKVLIESLKNRFNVEQLTTFFWPVVDGKKYFPGTEPKKEEPKPKENESKPKKQITLIEV